MRSADSRSLATPVLSIHRVNSGRETIEKRPENSSVLSFGAGDRASSFTTSGSPWPGTCIRHPLTLYTSCSSVGSAKTRSKGITPESSSVTTQGKRRPRSAGAHKTNGSQGPSIARVWMYGRSRGEISRQERTCCHRLATGVSPTRLIFAQRSSCCWLDRV
jgi:hypothetical protein